MYTVIFRVVAVYNMVGVAFPTPMSVMVWFIPGWMAPTWKKEVDTFLLSAGQHRSPLGKAQSLATGRPWGRVLLLSHDSQVDRLW